MCRRLRAPGDGQTTPPPRPHCHQRYEQEQEKQNRKKRGGGNRKSVRGWIPERADLRALRSCGTRAPWPADAGPWGPKTQTGCGRELTRGLGGAAWVRCQRPAPFALRSVRAPRPERLSPWIFPHMPEPWRRAQGPAGRWTLPGNDFVAHSNLGSAMVRENRDARAGGGSEAECVPPSVSITREDCLLWNALPGQPPPIPRGARQGRGAELASGISLRPPRGSASYKLAATAQVCRCRRRGPCSTTPRLAGRVPDPGEADWRALGIV